MPTDPGPHPPHIPPEIVPPAPTTPLPVPPTPTGPIEGDDLRSRIYEQLLARRTVFLDRPLSTDAASLVAAQLMTLDSDEAGDDGQAVTLMVNSPGGPVDAVTAVLDTIDLMRCPVDTTCIGQAVGTAAVVVAAGTGTRRAGAGAHLRLRFPEVELTGRAGQLGDEVARVREIQEQLVGRLAATTGQERRLLVRDIERGRGLTAEEAVTYGLVDEIAGRKT